MPPSHLRAADADREAVAKVLGEHMSAGRLTLDEFDERLARAFAAKTYGDLAELTADLPAPHSASTPPLPAAQGPVPAPAGHPGRPAPVGGCGSRGRSTGSPDLAQSWASWRTTSAIVLSIWLVSSLVAGFGYFWPIWVIVPWGAVLLAQSIAGRATGPGRRGIGR